MARPFSCALGSPTASVKAPLVVAAVVAVVLLIVVVAVMAVVLLIVVATVMAVVPTKEPIKDAHKSSLSTPRSV